jgi:septum site-determining protein MinC
VPEGAVDDGQAVGSDLGALLELLRQYNLVPVGFRCADEAMAQAARAAGLVEAPEAVRAPTRASTKSAPEPAVAESVAPQALPAATTLVIDKPLRSGQKAYARGGDLVMLAMVNQGAEVVADGNIHVYAPLRGKAMAGARGNTAARIFALSMEPELISIAGIYRTSENPLPASIRGKPAQIRLGGDDADKLIFEPLSA